MQRPGRRIDRADDPGLWHEFVLRVLPRRAREAGGQRRAAPAIGGASGLAGCPAGGAWPAEHGAKKARPLLAPDLELGSSAFPRRHCTRALGKRSSWRLLNRMVYCHRPWRHGLCNHICRSTPEDSYSKLQNYVLYPDVFVCERKRNDRNFHGIRTAGGLRWWEFLGHSSDSWACCLWWCSGVHPMDW